MDTGQSLYLPSGGLVRERFGANFENKSVPIFLVSDEVFEGICAGVMAPRRFRINIKLYFLIHCTEQPQRFSVY
jgi:hypothetical protein